MRRRTMGWAAVAVVLTMMAGTAVAQSQSQPLGDVARSNKPPAHPKRVITDDDMPARSGADSGSNGAAIVPETKVPEKAAPKVEETKPADKDADKDKEAAAKQERMAYLGKDLEAIQRQMDDMQTRLSNETEENRRAVWTEALQHLREHMDKEKNELEQLKAAPEKSATPKAEASEAPKAPSDDKQP